MLELVKRVGDDFEWSEAGVRSIEAVVLEMMADQKGHAPDGDTGGDSCNPCEHEWWMGEDCCDLPHCRKCGMMERNYHEPDCTCSNCHPGPDPLREAVWELVEAIAIVGRTPEPAMLGAWMREGVNEKEAKVRDLLGDEE